MEFERQCCLCMSQVEERQALLADAEEEQCSHVPHSAISLDTLNQHGMQFQKQFPTAKGSYMLTDSHTL